MTGARQQACAPIPACMILALAMAVLAEVRAADAEASASDDIDRTPVHTVIPEYPEKAREQRLQGEVQVCFYIDRAGHPYRIAVRKSTHRIFERPSIRAVRASTYAPLASGEELPGIKACRTFRYALESVDAI